MIPQNMQALAGRDKLILAEYQTDYTPLPALYDPVEHNFLTEWVFTPEEREIIAAGGVLRLWQFGARFQPVALEIVPERDRLPLEPTQ